MSSLDRKRSPIGNWPAFEEKMQREGLSPLATSAFAHYYQQLLTGVSGLISEADIKPVANLPELGNLEQFIDGDLRQAGHDVLDHTCVVKLNGGLGTSMGLDRAKSLLPVRDGLSFLDIIIRQTIALRKVHKCSIPLLLMNSFRSEADSEKVVTGYREFLDDQDGFASSFLQNKVPKILQDGFLPADYPQNPELEWCPPGHGDIYLALAQGGILSQLENSGYRYLFVSNADNLGAMLDLRILGYLALSKTEFLMEVAQRTEADSKGGHLAKTNSGHLLLREIAQCPQNEVGNFQDIKKYSYFNTNSLWIDIKALSALSKRQGGFLHLPLIKNSKRIDPQDLTSSKVYQLETAMGAAIALFDRANAICVPRSRFLPVKKTNDLLLLNSDLFELKPDSRLEQTSNSELPLVELDGQYFSSIADFQKRFAAGAPSLTECSRLEVIGDVHFGKSVKLQGEVSICNNSNKPQRIADNSIISGKHTFD